MAKNKLFFAINGYFVVFVAKNKRFSAMNGYFIAFVAEKGGYS